jgi:hypothetical protein
MCGIGSIPVQRNVPAPPNPTDYSVEATTPDSRRY